jgi:hypothetical protein
MNQAIREGMSLRGVASKFNASRSALQRHAKGCLRFKKSVAEETRALAKVKAEELDGDLKRAYERALEMQRKAEESGNTQMAIAATRHVARLLGMRSRAVKPLVDKTITMQESRWKNGLYPQFAVTFPLMVNESHGPFKDSSPAELAAADVLFRVEFINRRPAEDFNPREVEAQMRVTAEIAEARESDE